LFPPARMMLNDLVPAPPCPLKTKNPVQPGVLKRDNLFTTFS
jgi:hypothetical protein